MWSVIKEWYKRNKGYLMTLFLASLGVGVGIAVLSFFFPPVLAAVAGISIMGVTPLAFLMTMNVPLALLTLGAISTGVAFGVIAAGIVVSEQIITIGKHVSELFFTARTPINRAAVSSTYDYLREHLQPESSEEIVDDDEEYYEMTPVATLDFRSIPPDRLNPSEGTAERVHRENRI